MTTIADRADPMELNLQVAGSTRMFYYSQVLSRLDTVAHCVFAAGTPYTMLPVRYGGSPVPVDGAAAAPTTPSADPPGTDVSILDAIEDLRTWLNLSYDDLAKLLGWQSASNIHYWRRCARLNEPVRPRAASVEPILRLHALLRAISETISGDDPCAVQLWARTPLAIGIPTPLELLEQGRVDDIERHAASLLFGKSRGNVPAWRLVRPAPDDDNLVIPSAPVPYSADDFG
jgi:hypothetical protein